MAYLETHSPSHTHHTALFICLRSGMRASVVLRSKPPLTLRVTTRGHFHSDPATVTLWLADNSSSQHSQVLSSVFGKLFQPILQFFKMVENVRV